MTALIPIINYIVNAVLNITGGDPVLTCVIIAALVLTVFKLVKAALKSIAVITILGLVLYYTASVLPSLPAV